MIFNKTLTTLLFITLNMQCVAASSSDGTQEPSSSGEPAPPMKKRIPAPKPREVLKDASNNIDPVEVQRGIRKVEILQGRASNMEKVAPALEDTTNTVNDVMSRNNQVTTRGSVRQRLSSWLARSATEKFKKSIKEGSYWMARCLAITINDDDLLKLVCPIVKTIEQYNGIVKYLEHRNLVALFYVYGDFGVVKRAIMTEPIVYGDYIDYVKHGNLEAALPLALEKDRHDRVMELLDVRREIAAEMDEQPDQDGELTSFGCFVSEFLENLAPWEDGMAFRRFLFLRGCELRNKYRDILDTLCQWLVYHLSDELHFPNARELLDYLIGQPSLLTPVVFARKFLDYDDDGYRSNFIKYGWDKAIQEGLKSVYECGGEKLWLVMKRVRPEQFHGKFPETEEERIAVCAHFPTKQQKEEEWIKNNAAILYNRLKHHESISSIFPDVLWSIIAEYAVPWVDIESQK